MSKKILGLDLGTNSIGWALLEDKNGKPEKIIDLGVRIFTKAVEEQTPTPKNVKRRNKRLTRRVLQRRARRKQRLLNYLIKLSLMPLELKDNTQPEGVLNGLGDPYILRAKALDEKLSSHELGRVLLHLVQRRGFLSSRKTLLGDMVDDPDVKAALEELEQTKDNATDQAKEEAAFKKDISQLRIAIQNTNRPFTQGKCRTLGEYLATFDRHDCKRNRIRNGGHLRTDRQMYRDELESIWQQQQQHHKVLTDEVRQEIESILFYQRPLKLRPDRIGKCSLEPKNNRAQIARLEYQRLRYLQDINNLKYFNYDTDRWVDINTEDKKKLVALFETKSNPTLKTHVRERLGLDRGTEFNLEQGDKKLKGNITACTIRTVLPAWDELSEAKQFALVEDLLTIKKKSVLKKRLLDHWQFDTQTAVNLCLLEFEPGYGNLSVKAIKKLLPYLSQGQIFSDARVSAGYGYEEKEIGAADRLGTPPEIPNPIVQRGLHELRRVINAIVAEYGKPDAIRIEMARDLEMNTKRYTAYLKQQKANTAANNKAVEQYKEMARMNPHLRLSSYPSRNDKIKYRLWIDQDKRCAYSGKTISLSTLFSAEIDVDHILPYSESLDDSYMNKVVCYAEENRFKGQRTPVDAFTGDKWQQITQSIARWDRKLESKVNRFYRTKAELMERDFISNQLNDTRYISKVAHDYLKQLGADISVSKGITTAWARHQWDLNTLLGEANEKERTDHRHHAIDAVVVACIDRAFYQALVKTSKDIETSRPELSMRDIHFEPPWANLKDELGEKLDDVIIAHAPQLKLSGELHEETGAGYIEGIGTVYRINLLPDKFKQKQLEKVIDDDVRELLAKHLEKYNNNPKEAFAEGITVYHKDGKTPIRRIRIRQSNTTLAKLEKSKFGARNKDGNIFKWLPYGNLHHVEIIRNRDSGEYSGRFVTMMEANHRAKGIGRPKQSVVNTEHGEGQEFVMALHINDLVSIEIGGNTRFYRVQKLDSGGNRIILRLHTTTNLDNKEEEIYLSINKKSITAWSMKKLKINAIGKPVA